MISKTNIQTKKKNKLNQKKPQPGAKGPNGVFSERGFLPIRNLLLNKLVSVGILAARTVETQRLSNGELVVTGIESGGATAQLGHYVTFCDEIGAKLVANFSYIGGLGFNSRHVDVAAKSLIKVEMLREGPLYQLLITRHEPDPARVGSVNRGSRVRVLFDSRKGYLPLELTGKDQNQRGNVLPKFMSSAGEELELPTEWHAAGRAVTAAVNCLQCVHAHYVIPLTPPRKEGLALVQPAPHT